MDWILLEQESQLEELRERSFTRPQVIFKHSTRCSISSVAKNRLDKSASPDNMDFYYLDLIRYRLLSAKVAEMFKVHHESPQALVIKEGKCIYDESHMGISMQEMVDAV
ncbi:MAG: bacillithiol system redox-active protein YtxJ [Flavitalea sp.]